MKVVSFTTLKHTNGATRYVYPASSMNFWLKSPNETNSFYLVTITQVLPNRKALSLSPRPCSEELKSDEPNREFFVL